MSVPYFKMQLSGTQQRHDDCAVSLPWVGGVTYRTGVGATDARSETLAYIGAAALGSALIAAVVLAAKKGIAP